MLGMNSNGGVNVFYINALKYCMKCNTGVPMRGTSVLCVHNLFGGYRMKVQRRS